MFDWSKFYLLGASGKGGAATYRRTEKATYGGRRKGGGTTMKLAGVRRGEHNPGAAHTVRSTGKGQHHVFAYGAGGGRAKKVKSFTSKKAAAAFAKAQNAKGAKGEMSRRRKPAGESNKTNTAARAAMMAEGRRANAERKKGNITGIPRKKK